MDDVVQTQTNEDESTERYPKAYVSFPRKSLDKSRRKTTVRDDKPWCARRLNLGFNDPWASILPLDRHRSLSLWN